MFHAERDSVSTPSGVRSVRFGNNGLVSRRSQWPELRNHAIVQVSLPAQAELVINGRAIGKPGSNVRGVLTPELDPGSRYTYDVVIRLNQGGQLISRTRRVRFVRGEQLHVDFTNLDKPVVQRIASR
ncbi:MAG: TIGR03000 domain-containing protein [Gemmataceae bacterium]